MAGENPLECLVEPRTALELQIVRMWEDLLDRTPIGVDDDFFQMGGDSVLAMTLLARIVQETDYTLPAGGIFQAPTVAKLAEALQSEASAESWDPLVPIQPEGSKTPFFCVHPGGGNILCYLQLSRRLGPEQPFFGLQAPGVDGIREPLSSIDEMAREYIRAIRRVHPHGPYLLGGWSVGGVIALEIAQQLRGAGQDVGTVIVLDSGVLYACAILTALFPAGGLGALDVVRSSSSSQVDEFRRRSAAARLVPDAADDHVAGLIFRVFTSNMRAVFNYRPRSYEGRVDLLQASEAIVKQRFEPIREWRRLCDRVELHKVPGNHLTMVQDPHVAEVARIVEHCLADATADSSHECGSAGTPA